MEVEVGVLWRTGILRREHVACVPNEDSEFHLKGKENLVYLRVLNDQLRILEILGE